MIKRLRRRMTILMVAVLVIVTAGIVLSINYMNWRNITKSAHDALDTLAENSGARPSAFMDTTGGPPALPEGEVPAVPGEAGQMGDPGQPGDPGQMGNPVQVGDPGQMGDPGQTGDPAQMTDPGQTGDPGQMGTAGQQEIPADDGASDSAETEIGEIADTEGTQSTEPGAMGNPADHDPPDKPTQGQPVDPENAMAALSNYYVINLNTDGTVNNWSSDRADLYSDEQIQDMATAAQDTGKNDGRIGTQFFQFANQRGQEMLIVLDERLEINSARRVLRMTIIIAGVACLLLCIAAYMLICYMVRPVQDAFEKQRQFVWDASHELKTPLAVISANADVLQGEIGDNEYLGYIRSEVKRTNKLVGSLLTLARMDQKKVAPQLTDTDLSKAVLAVALPFESSAFEAGRHFETDIHPGVRCRGDAEMLKELTVLLLSNALKYSDKGDRVSVSVRARGRGAELRVANTGEGISPEDLCRIFDRFFRADTSHNSEKEGNGLGLSIAKNIVDMHKGKIRVTSDPAGSRYETVFTVTLP